MNKSKFLKRSLATLLAILMVVAMVPSALAATTEPDVIKVQGVAVEFSGESATVSITAPNGTASVIENALKNVSFELRSKNGTAVGILDKNGSQKTVDLAGWPDAPGTKQTINLLSYAVKPEDTYWGEYTGIKLRVIPKTGDPVNYPLTITVSERSASSNTDITSIESTRIVDARIEGRDITIVKPVGTDSKRDTLGLTADSFKLAGAGATVDFTYDATATQVVSKVTVTAEDKSTKIYDVHYEIEPIFNEFTLKDIEVVDYSETEDGISTNEYSGNGKKNITVKVPYAAFDKKIIPTFATSGQVIKVTSKSIAATPTDSFNDGDGVLFERNVGTTSGVGVWAYGASANNEANTITDVLSKKFKFDVQTDVSSLYDNDSSDANVGEVTVTFIPVKNAEAKLTGVNVGDASGATTYSQGLVEIDTTNSSVIIGDIPNKNLQDNDNEKDQPRVINLTKRDIELQVSKNAKVTILNPTGLLTGDSTVYNDAVAASGNVQVDDATYTTAVPEIKDKTANSGALAAHDGKIVLNDVDVRKYHSTPMRVLVTSEDGANNTEYRINFNGTPDGKPEIKKVILHGKAGTDVAGTTVESTQDKKGNIIIHVPDKSGLDGTNSNPIKDAYDKITVETTDGSTAAFWGGTGYNHQSVVTEESATATVMSYGYGKSEADTYFPGLSAIYDDAAFYAEIHASFDKDMTTACDATVDGTKESSTPVFIYIDGPAETSNITEITLTPEEHLYKATNGSAQFTGVINHNNKTIRLNVPYSFNRDKDGNAISTGTDLYLYDWEFNGEKVSESGTPGTPLDITDLHYDYADLGDQTEATGTNQPGHVQHKILVNLKEAQITSLANLSKFTPAKAADNKNVIGTFSEEDKTAATATQEYIVYAVRANASGESKLNGMSASAPVSVALDTKVDKLNRYIITVPENYNNADGINATPEFELNFAERSEHSKVMNGQTTWVERGENTAKFKVLNDKLYFKNQPANLTDGRVIHFTIVAEDGTSTGAYEFEIRTTEANDDATVSSVMVDANVSFTQNGTNFEVENLEDNELYDVTKLPVIVNTTDPAATVTIDGKDYKYEWGVGSNITVDLSEGKTVPMVVTAADGETTANYTLSMASKGVTPPDPDKKPSDNYTDIPAAPMGDYVKSAIDNGIMVGTSATKFSPNMTVSRWQFALLIARADLRVKDPAITTADQADAELLRVYSGTPKFDDTKNLDKDLYRAAINYCNNNGIIDGNNGKFEPNRKVTRLEAARMISDWTKVTDETKTENTNAIKDWNKVNWGKHYLNSAYDAGFITGYPNGNFGPADSLTRGQAAVIIMKAYEYAANN